jgi:hypothetical protein
MAMYNSFELDQEFMVGVKYMLVIARPINRTVTYKFMISLKTDNNSNKTNVMKLSIIMLKIFNYFSKVLLEIKNVFSFLHCHLSN